MARTKLSRNRTRKRSVKSTSKQQSLEKSSVTEKQDSIQLLVNQAIYDLIYTTYLEISNELGHNVSTNIVITAICTNLGIAIAQLPGQVRNDFLKLSYDIISKSLLSAIKKLDMQSHGQVGHA